MPDPHLAAVHKLLADVEPGKLSEETTRAVIRELQEVWDELEGATDAKMTAQKLDRACEWAWTPPFLLQFSIVRHGGMVAGGSSRGERQKWSVNVQTGKAERTKGGFAQLKPNRPSFPYSLAVQKIAGLLSAGPAARIGHDGIVWAGSDKARVTLSRFLPDATNKATQASQTRRLRDKLILNLSQLGWDVEREKPLTFSKRK